MRGGCRSTSAKPDGHRGVGAAGRLLQGQHVQPPLQGQRLEGPGLHQDRRREAFGLPVSRTLSLNVNNWGGGIMYH